jgi:hypothetical protein
MTLQGLKSRLTYSILSILEITYKLYDIKGDSILGSIRESHLSINIYLSKKTKAH